MPSFLFMYSIHITLAEINICLSVHFRETLLRLKPFMTASRDDSICLVISHDRIRAEKDLLSKTHPNLTFTEIDSEWNAIYRDLSIILYENGVVLYHGVLVAESKSGYLFTGKSGVGKSTHTKLWKAVFGETITIINGDKPLIRIREGKLIGYGSPWMGKEGYGENSSVEIKAICNVCRGIDNDIHRINNGIDAITWLYDGIMIKDRTHYNSGIFNWIRSIIPMVSLYSLCCNMDKEAAIVAYNGMK